MSLAVLVHVTDEQPTKMAQAGQDTKRYTHSHKSVNSKVPVQRRVSRFDASKMSQTVSQETSHCDIGILFILKLLNSF